MKLKLDANSRKFIKVDVEVEDENFTLKYYEINTKQIKELKDLSKKEGTKMYEIDEMQLEQFKVNLSGEESDKQKLFDFYEENGNIYDLMHQLNEELGKQKKRG